MKLKMHKYNFSNAAIGLFLVFMYFSSFLSQYFIFIAAIIILLLLVGMPVLQGKKHDWLLGIVFLLFTVRNGDLAHSAYGAYARFLLCFIVFFFMKSMYDAELTILRVTFSMTIIHILFGFYFLLNPSLFLNKIYPFLQITDEFSSTLFSQINKGYMVGLTSHYSTLGMYFAFGVILFFAKFFNVKKGKTWWGIAIVVLMIAFLLNQKRGPMLFSLAAVLVIYILYYRRLKISTILGWCAVFIALAVLYYKAEAFDIISNFLQRFDTDDLTSGRWEQLWMPAVKIFLQHPLIGIGWRGYKYQFQAYSTYPRSVDAHNIYLQLLCETGLIGTIFFIILFIFITKYSCKVMKSVLHNVSEKVDICSFFLLGIQIYFYLYGFTGNSLYDLPLYLYVISAGYFFQLGNRYNIALFCRRR